MLPVMHLFGRTITLYGLMIVIGLITGIAIAVRRSKTHGFQPIDVLFASIFGGIGLFVGAKLLFILVMVPEFIRHFMIYVSHPSLLEPLLAGGFVFYGGLIGAAVGCYIYCRIYKLPYLKMLDHIAPSIPLIHGFGRLGCFFAGCCYGIVYDGPGHIVFHGSEFAPPGIPLFPTQLLESGLNLIAAALLLMYAKSERKTGRVIGVYITYYAVMRFFMEFLRGDLARGSIFGLSTSQWISLVLLPIGIWFILGVMTKKK